MPDEVIDLEAICLELAKRMLGSTDPNMTVDLSGLKIEVLSFSYGDYVVPPTKPALLYQATWHNHTAEVDVQQLKKDYTNTVEATWHVNVGIKGGAKTTAKVGFPRIAEGKVELSLEISVEAGYSRSVTTEEAWTVDDTVKVSPHSTTEATIMIDAGKVTVPFTAVLGISGYWHFSPGSGLNAAALRLDPSGRFTVGEKQLYEPVGEGGTPPWCMALNDGDYVQCIATGTFEGTMGIRQYVNTQSTPLLDAAVSG